MRLSMRVVAVCALMCMTLLAVCCVPVVGESSSDSSVAFARGVRRHAAAAPASRAIKVVYYIEAYCARCIDVLTGSLRALMASPLSALVALDLVPFGNGERASDGTITCQHGERECEANTLQGCAQKLYPTSSKWLPYILCMETGSDPLDAAASCAAQVGLDYHRISTCAKGEEGRAILATNAARTHSCRTSPSMVDHSMMRRISPPPCARSTAGKIKINTAKM
jgi:hypothetical protein